MGGWGGGREGGRDGGRGGWRETGREGRTEARREGRRDGGESVPRDRSRGVCTYLDDIDGRRATYIGGRDGTSRRKDGRYTDTEGEKERGGIAVLRLSVSACPACACGFGAARAYPCAFTLVPQGVGLHPGQNREGWKQNFSASVGAVALPHPHKTPDGHVSANTREHR